MTKRNPLVCQHLENVSRDVLEQNEKIVRQYVRHRQGVYALHMPGGNQVTVKEAHGGKTEPSENFCL
jgi:hypothetical protein